MSTGGRGRAMPIAVAILALAGLAASAYLLNIYFQVRLGEATGDSLCTLSETVNCEKVAASEYSIFLGIPFAVWGLVMYGVLLLGALVRVARPDGEGFRWEPVLFWAPLIVFVHDLYLAWLQLTCIGSICLGCFLTYVLNLLIFLIVLASRGFDVPGLIRDVGHDLRFLFGRALRAVVTLVLGAAALGVVGWFMTHPMGGVDLPIASTGPDAVREAVRGPRDAPVTVVGVTDFQCPFCARAAFAVEEVLGRYPGRVRFEHVDYPLDNACNPYIPKPFHVQACLAAKASRCAARQDRYWAYHHLLFEHQRGLAGEKVIDLARTLELDEATFRACLEDRDGTLKRALAADIERARAFDIKGTPSFVVNGTLYSGFLSVEKWIEILTPLAGPPSDPATR